MPMNVQRVGGHGASSGTMLLSVRVTQSDVRMSSRIEPTVSEPSSAADSAGAETVAAASNPITGLRYRRDRTDPAKPVLDTVAIGGSGAPARPGRRAVVLGRRQRRRRP